MTLSGYTFTKLLAICALCGSAVSCNSVNDDRIQQLLSTLFLQMSAHGTPTECPAMEAAAGSFYLPTEESRQDSHTLR